MATEIGPRTEAWNVARESARHAAGVTRQEGEVDFWPISPVACLLSLTLKEGERRLRDARGHGGAAANHVEAARLRWLLAELDALFAAARTWNLGAGTRHNAEAPDELDFAVSYLD